MEVEMSENLAEQVIRPSYEQIVGSIRHSGVQEILRRAVVSVKFCNSMIR